MFKIQIVAFSAWLFFGLQISILFLSGILPVQCSLG